MDRSHSRDGAGVRTSVRRHWLDADQPIRPPTGVSDCPPAVAIAEPVAAYRGEVTRPRDLGLESMEPRVPVLDRLTSRSKVGGEIRPSLEAGRSS